MNESTIDLPKLETVEFLQKLSDWKELFEKAQREYWNNNDQQKLLIKYIQNNPMPLPIGINTLNWVVYKVEANYIVNPSVLSNLSKLVNNPIAPEIFFGSDYFEQLKADFENDEYFSKNPEEWDYGHLDSRLSQSDIDYYNGIENKEFSNNRLKNCVHWVDHDDYVIIISSKPMSNNLAELLGKYNLCYLDKINKFVKSHDQAYYYIGMDHFIKNYIYHEFDEDSSYFLKLDGFIQKQMALRETLIENNYYENILDKLDLIKSLSELESKRVK